LQVDYEPDVSWTGWCETALRQLLEGSLPPANGTASVSTLGNSLPGSTTRSIPETWNHPRHIEPSFVTPASHHTAPDTPNEDGLPVLALYKHKVCQWTGMIVMTWTTTISNHGGNI
jgi:hypothetical protein